LSKFFEYKGWIPTAAPNPSPAANDGSSTGAQSTSSNPTAPPQPPASTLNQDTGTEAERGERIRLLSFDGFTDPRNDNTELDTEFIILHDLAPFPATFQASREQRDEVEALESTVAQYQLMMRELEGNVESENRR
jgi:hypothetical protein